MVGRFCKEITRRRTGGGKNLQRNHKETPTRREDFARKSQGDTQAVGRLSHGNHKETRGRCEAFTRKSQADTRAVGRLDQGIARRRTCDGEIAQGNRKEYEPMLFDKIRSGVDAQDSKYVIWIDMTCLILISAG